MMIKKHIMTSKVVFLKDDFIEFDYNMVLSSNINHLQSYDDLKVLDDQVYVLYFKFYTDFNSVYDLIKMKQFNETLFNSLLGQIENLEKELESYLLDMKKINFDPAYILFDEVKQRFLFRYLPCKYQDFSYDVLALCRFIAFETPLIDYEQLRDASAFSVSKFKDLINPKVHKKDQNHRKNQLYIFSWWRKPRKGHDASTALSGSSAPPPNTTQRMNYPLLFDKSNPEQSIKVFFDINIIGREETANIRIDDASVSRQHAQLIHQKNQFKLIDLNSTNGTFVNQEHIDEKVVVNGDIIQIGNKEFIFIR